MPKVVGKIFETTDYKLFKNLKGNRVVNRTHYNHLKKSHSEEALFSPITVTPNGKGYNVIDGMHRLRVRQELGLPVMYTVVDDYGIEQVQKLNTNNKQWGWDDYLHCYNELGNPEYKQFKTFMEKFQFNYSSCMAIIKNRVRYSGGREFKLGYFVFPKGKEKTAVYERASMIHGFAPFYRNYRRRTFVIACVQMFKSNEYDHQHMLKQCNNYSSEIVDCTTWQRQLELMEEIYNHDQKKRVVFDYDVKLEKEVDE